MMNRLRKIAGLLLVSCVCLAVAVPALAAGGTAALRPLKAYPGVAGTAQYEVNQGQRELQVEVAHVRSLAGRSVAIFVGGTKVGSARVNSRGVVEFSRNTEHGQRVPQVGAGTPIAVATVPGALMLVGSF
jgi:hypothetical protein